jgi:hypothetical protein
MFKKFTVAGTRWSASGIMFFAEIFLKRTGQRSRAVSSTFSLNRGMLKTRNSLSLILQVRWHRVCHPDKSCWQSFSAPVQPRTSKYADIWKIFLILKLVFPQLEKEKFRKGLLEKF